MSDNSENDDGLRNFIVLGLLQNESTASVLQETVNVIRRRMHFPDEDYDSSISANEHVDSDDEPANPETTRNVVAAFSHSDNSNESSDDEDDMHGAHDDTTDEYEESIDLDDSDDSFYSFNDIFQSQRRSHISETELDSEIGKLQIEMKMHDFSDRSHPMSLNDLIYAGKCLGFNDYYTARRLNGGYLRRKLAVAPEMVCGLRMENQLVGHRGCVNALGFGYLQDGRFLVSGADDRCALIWDWEEAKLLHRMETGCSNNVFQTKFLDNGMDDSIIVTSHDGSVRICSISPGAASFTKKLQHNADVTHGCTTQLLHKHTSACHKVSFPAGQTKNVLLSCGEDCCVYERDLRESHSRCIVYVKQTPLYGIANHPFKTSEFSIAGMSPYIRVFDRRFLHQDIERLNSVRQYAIDSALSDHTQATQLGNESEDNIPPNNRENRSIFALHLRSKYDITSLVYSCYGEHILASYNDEDIYLFDNNSPSGSSPIRHYYGHRNHNTVKGVNFFGAHSEYVISGGDDGFIYIWDKDTEAIVSCSRSDKRGVVNVVKPHPSDHSILASSGLDNKIKMWRTYVDYRQRPLLIESYDHPPDLIENDTPSQSTPPRPVLISTESDTQTPSFSGVDISRTEETKATPDTNSLYEIPSAKRFCHNLMTDIPSTSNEVDQPIHECLQLADVDMKEVELLNTKSEECIEMNEALDLSNMCARPTHESVEILNRPSVLLPKPPYDKNWLLKKVALNLCERKAEQLEKPVWTFMTEYFPPTENSSEEGSNSSHSSFAF